MQTKKLHNATLNRFGTIQANNVRCVLPGAMACKVKPCRCAGTETNEKCLLNQVQVVDNEGGTAKV